MMRHGTFGLGLALTALLAACGSTAAPAASTPAKASVGSPATNSASASGAASPISPASASSAASPISAVSASSVASASGTTASKPAPLSPVVKVQVGDPRFTPMVPVYIALDRGYFKDQGLDVSLVATRDASQLDQALAAGQLQFGAVGPDAGLFNAMARGVNVKLVASMVTNRASDKTADFLVRADLIASGRYKSPADLKGMTVAVPAEQSEFYVSRLLAQGGLTDKDVTFTTLTLPDIVPALGNKAIDAASEVEPLVTAAEKQGFAKVVATTGQLFPGAMAQALAMSPGFGKDQPAAAQRFVVAYVQGLRDYYHAFVAKDGDKAPVVQALVNHTAVKDPKLFDIIGLHSVNPNGAMDVKTWDPYQDYFLKRGFQKERLDLNKYVDSSYVDAAVKQLGSL